METAAQSISRLLGALETLTREEHLLLEHGMFAEATAVQKREQPLVARIVELLFQPGVAAALESSVQKRAQVLIEAQRTQADKLALAIRNAREPLDQIRSAHTRAQKLRPAYKSESAPSLSFAGEA